MRTRTLVVLALFLAPLVPVGLAGTGPDPPRVECPDPNPPLPGPPQDLERPPGPADTLRMDPDGVTITLLVEDPTDVPAAYTYHPAADGAPTGTFAHPWPTERNIMTLGVYTDGPSGRVRLPLFIGENLEGPDVTAILDQMLAGQIDPLGNALNLAVRTLLPQPGKFDTVGTDAYRNREPILLWPVHRTLPEGELWMGVARTHQGNALPFDDGTTTIEQFCRRTQVDLVTRDATTTRYDAGIYLIDELRKQGPSEAAEGTWTASQTLTMGSSVAGHDVPLAWVHAGEDFQGASDSYANQSQNDLTLGVVLDDGPRPLIGVRSNATHDTAPDAERRMLSLGIYDTQGGYHPQIGVRSHFEEHASQDWVFDWLGLGPGAALGDWVMDLGTFDPWGRFMPHVRATYDDSLDEVVDQPTGVQARHEAEMMLTAGIMAADDYVPLVGTTYDGASPLLTWIERNQANDSDAMGPWRTSAGTFTPPATYVPAIGATYAPANQTGYAVAESYRVGAYAGTYTDFIPLAGAEWAAGHTSLAWANAYAAGLAAVPSDARLDVGIQTPVTGFVPLAGAMATRGASDHYTIGAWAGQGFVPMLAACVVPVNSGVGVGIGAAGEPIGAAGLQGEEPAYVLHEDCDALEP